MSREPFGASERIFDYLAGALPAEEARALELAMREDPAFAAEVQRAEESFMAMALDLEPVEPPPALRDRLLAEVTGVYRFEPFIDRLAGLLHVAADTARGFLGALADLNPWEVLVPGVRLIDLVAGPELATVRVGLVHVEPGACFPMHRHIGEELSLILQGRLRFQDGSEAVPGDLVHMEDGSIHAFTAVSAEPVVFAVIVGEIETVEFV